MIIGTIRPEEAKVSDSHAGYHQFHAPTGEKYGSFEVFWDDEKSSTYDERGDYAGPVEPGWYWWPCFPGCSPDGEMVGPFSSSLDAMLDADEWHPDYLD